MRSIRFLCFVVFASALATACTTTDVRSIAQPPALGAKVLLVYPDVQLSLLTTAGIEEPREDWSQTTSKALASSMQTALDARKHTYEALDPNASMQGRAGQVLRLNSAVGLSIFTYEYGALRLPTKAAKFDWTVGPGAASLARERGADYAMFIGGRGSFASAGRMALMVGAAVLGVGVPLGAQQVFVSLVELRTGRVVWFNIATAGSGTDIRTPEGARVITEKLLASAPL